MARLKIERDLRRCAACVLIAIRSRRSAACRPESPARDARFAGVAQAPRSTLQRRSLARVAPDARRRCDAVAVSDPFANSGTANDGWPEASLTEARSNQDREGQPRPACR